MPRNDYGRLETVERGDGISMRCFDRDGSILFEVYGMRNEEDLMRSRAANIASGQFRVALADRDRMSAAMWREQEVYNAREARRLYLDYYRAWTQATEDAVRPGIAQYDREYYESRARDYANAIVDRTAALEQYGASVTGEVVTFPPELASRMGEYVAIDLSMFEDGIRQAEPPEDVTIEAFDPLQTDINDGWVVNVH